MNAEGEDYYENISLNQIGSRARPNGNDHCFCVEPFMRQEMLRYDRAHGHSGELFQLIRKASRACSGLRYSAEPCGQFRAPNES